MANMSFSRAFSTKRRDAEPQISAPMHIGRAMSQRGGRPVQRAMISSPVALVSTSNQHIYDANTIAGTSPIEIRHVSSGSSASSSSDESDMSTTGSDGHDTVTDASSVDGSSSPIGSEPEPNHLSCYFKPAVDTQNRTSNSRSTAHSSISSTETTPRLPQRAPSHSKRAHEGVHRKRSIQRMLSPPRSLINADVTMRSSAEMFAPYNPTLQQHSSSFVEAPKETNPFGKELAQLDEVAEEFGQVVRNAEKDADEVYMEAHGLCKFPAVQYFAEIESLYLDMVAEEDVSEGEGAFF